MDNEYKLIATLGLAGGLVGFAQVLAKGGRFDWKLALARAILNGALGVSAAVASVWFPTISLPALVGLACFLSSIGTSGVEKLLQRWIGGANGGQ